MSIRTFFCLVLLPLAMPAMTQEGPLRIEAVEFADGSGSRVFSDSIGGFERVNYRVTLREGQWLTVTLDTNNLSNCFDIVAPLAAKPIFVGANAGNNHRLHAQVGGDYLIHVHLLRLAARDNQSAVYTLNVQVYDDATDKGERP